MDIQGKVIANTGGGTGRAIAKIRRVEPSPQIVRIKNPVVSPVDYVEELVVKDSLFVRVGEWWADTRCPSTYRSVVIDHK